MMHSLNAALAVQIVDDRTAEGRRRMERPRVPRPTRFRRRSSREPEQTSVRDLMTLVAQPVAVVTGVAPDGALAGMTVSSLTSVSAEPPMVLFCPSRRSRTWAAIAPSGRFVVNVLAADQQEVAELFSGPEKPFARVSHRVGDDGLPVLTGVLAAARCTTAVVRQGGDHHVVLARLDDLSRGTGTPLTYWRRSYSTVAVGDQQRRPSP
jgi:3-hydroxy-9,10-secoandrosta-1,3,5(10)-triene-9,17-dione monooxygenase reductase component